MKTKKCNFCGNSFHSLGFASHRSACFRKNIEEPRENKLKEMQSKGWNIKRNDFDKDSFHFISDKGIKSDLLTRAEAIGKGFEAMHHSLRTI